MKLQDALPDRMTFGGKQYKLDLDFRNVLRMMETLSRDELMPEARTFLALKCIMRRPPRDAEGALSQVREIVFPGTKQTAAKEKITDFSQDADLIRAAFMQCYGINLFRGRLHWLEFSSLLAGLPEGSRYSEVLGIRARPMPAPTKWNAEERRWLMKAKAEYALRMTDREQEKSLNNSLRSVAFSLLALAEKGSEHHA